MKYIMMGALLLSTYLSAEVVPEKVIPPKKEVTKPESSPKRSPSFQKGEGTGPLYELKREQEQATIELNKIQKELKVAPPSQREMLLREASQVKKNLETKILQLQRKIAIQRGDFKRAKEFGTALDKRLNPWKYAKNVEKRAPRERTKENNIGAGRK